MKNEFVLIDMFEEEIKGKKFAVLVVYDISSHNTSKVFFVSDNKTYDRLKELWNEFSYQDITQFCTFVLGNDGKAKLRITY